MHISFGNNSMGQPHESVAAKLNSTTGPQLSASLTMMSKLLLRLSCMCMG